MSDRNWPMARSERREGARAGLGTMARPGGRPRQARPVQDGPVQDAPPAQDSRRARHDQQRQPRPVPPQRGGPGLTGAQRNQRVAPQQATAERPAVAPVARASAARGSAARGSAASPSTGRAATARAPWRVPPARRTAAPRPPVPRGPQAEPAQPQQTGTQAKAQPPGGPATATGPHRMPFVLLLCGLLGGALISALVISTTLAAGSFKISKLQDETSALARQRQALAAQVAQAKSAQVIAERAGKLGMRRTGELWFVDLTSGKTTNDGPAWAGAAKAPGYAP
jgi:hypothetical protein